MSTITNPQEVRSFYQNHIQDQKYITVYKKLGYLKSDLEEISPLTIQTQSASFLKNLNPQDKEFYIKKKYEALVFRRDKIIREVNSRFQKEIQKEQSGNYSMLTESVDRKKYKIFNQLSLKQKDFYQKKNKYYTIVKEMKQKKIKEYHDVQENSFINSEHYKSLAQKRSLSNISNSSSIKSYRSKKNQMFQKKRQSIKEKYQFLCDSENESKRKSLEIKLRDNKKKIQRVYQNLRNLSQKKKREAQNVEKKIHQNKCEIQVMDQLYLTKKKERIYRQMKKFQENRKIELLKRDTKLQTQKKEFQEKQSLVKQYKQFVEEQIQNHGKELNSKMKKTLHKKLQLQQLRKLQIKQLSQFRKQKHFSTIKSKQKQKHDHHIKNLSMYQKYNKNLKSVIQTKNQKTRELKMKLMMEEKIKQQIAKKNLQVKNRQEQQRKSDLISKYSIKKNTVQEILQLKDSMINQRRLYLDQTIKQIQDIDKQFSSRTMLLNSIKRPMTSDMPSYTNRSFKKMGRTTDSFYKVKKAQSYIIDSLGQS